MGEDSPGYSRCSPRRASDQAPDSYSITTNDDLERGLFVVKVESINPAGVIQLGLIAGDFVHNLRSSLDHLAWELAKVGKKRPSSETSFPICGVSKNTPRALAKIDARISACTNGMPAGAIALVKSFQPFHDGSTYKSNHLWRLNYLWNLDKHRNMALHSVDSGVLFEVFQRGISVTEEKFDDRTIVSMPLAVKDKVRFNPGPDIQVTFGDEERGVKVTIEDLRDIYEFVSRKVFPAFASYIP